jgi:Na+/H+-dicarboxylate symporter
MSFNFQLVLGSIAGISIGVLLNFLGMTHPAYAPTVYVSQIIGKGIFINLLKMMIIPLVFTSITIGIAHLRSHAQMSKVWKLTLIYFLSTSFLAASLGLVVMNILKPGVGIGIAQYQDSMAQLSVTSTNLGDWTKTFLAGLFMNPIAAMSKGEILPTIIFAMFLGIALVASGEERSSRIIQLFQDFFDLIMIIIGWVMKILPVGLMALFIDLFATQDIKLLQAMGKFIVIVIACTLFHGFVLLPLILKAFSKQKISVFFSSVKEALVTAVSTSSSSATLPVTLRCVENNLKVNKDVAGFVVPLGATVNMDGTALYEAMAALFVANLVGLDLNLVQQVVVVFMAVIASIGAPGIPSAGMVTMMMVFQSVGLPAEAVAILIPFDRPLDALRTMVNVEGDMVGSVIVDQHVRSS